MMKKILCILGLYLPVTIFSQEKENDKGIQWSQGLSWQQVRQKAKKENKYIFVDCYATWCKPCKAMDDKVYTVDSVATYLNTGFIAVKLQMDKTAYDNAEVKSWRKTASVMSTEWNVNAYPTMLFFTPYGELATKEVGYKDAREFIAMAGSAKDPSKQYYVLLNNYKKGKLDDATKRSVIMMAKQINDTTTYRALRDSYLAKLHTLPKEKLYTKENLGFIASVINSRKQSVFDMFYPDGSSVDKVMQNNGYSRKVVDEVIRKEKVSPVVNAAIEATVELDWSALYNSIKQSYGNEYAARNVLLTKADWYFRKDWMKYADALNDMMEKYGTDTTDRGEEFRLNTKASMIWENVGNRKEITKDEVEELSRVCAWMEGVVRRGEMATEEFRLRAWPLYIDTYANLLYKIGKTAEAIKWQELAVSKGRELKTEENYISAIEENLSMMKKGERTWPVEEK